MTDEQGNEIEIDVPLAIMLRRLKPLVRPCY
jgi:hypothetical protein